MIRIAVQSLFLNRTGAIAAAVTACALYLPGPLWGQFVPCASGSQTCTTSASVGIGTTTPTAPLHVYTSDVGLLLQGTSASKAVTLDINNAAGDPTQGGLIFQRRNPATGGFEANLMAVNLANGNVGIANITPLGKLHLGSASSGSGTPTYRGSIILDEYSATLNANMGLEFATRGDSNGFGWRVSSLANNTDLVFESRTASPTWSEKIRFLNNGYVGIGTTAPQSLLAVKGTITAMEVVVTNTGWSDYVFNSGYRLKPLTEVASYIKEHHHLPEIPPEAEIKEKGVSVGDMQSKLLAKIEELTLHMIQLQARIAQLEAHGTPGEVKTERHAPNNPNN